MAAREMMERLSRPLSDLSAHYDVIVVGSGYGGSIAACRLARAGRRVAVLERGRELVPGEYPRTMEAAARHFQTSDPLGDSGDPRNLYWLHVGGGMNVFSGCGLGGTSLVNANVALRPDPRVFEDERWPRALREDPSALDAGFERAEAMFTPTTYPSSFPPLAKLEALRRSANGAPFSLTPINVTFRAGPNAAGVHQEACTGCGDCVTGCNYGAKNTLLMNYLPDAASHGAEIFTEVDVRWVEREGPATDTDGGARWVVRAQPLGLGRDRFEAPPMAVTADVVVLAAGVLGTTRVLFQSRQRGLDLSDQLGQHFTGNGDVLGFAYRPGQSVHGVGAGPDAPDPEHPVGPCITAFIDERGGRPLAEGVIIEDAAVPGAIAGLLPIGLGSQASPDWLRGRLRGDGPIAALLSVVTRGRRGLTQHLQTLLAMGNDGDEGSVALDGDRVRVIWPGAGTSSYYELANRVVGTAAAQDGGTFLHNPIWSRALEHSLITVHPLGGCVMADRAENGVVDDMGRAFSGRTGDAVHEGLMVWDGSIVSRPLGVNPLLTISALTERAVAALVADNGWPIDSSVARPNPDQSLAAPPQKPGLRFTERMSGFWSPTDAPDAGDLAQYELAAAAGEEAGSTLAFELTLSTDDLRAEIADLARPMSAVGTVEAPGFSDDPVSVDDGTFQLLVADDQADTAVSHMWYRLPLTTTGGRRLHFSGFKAVGPGELAGLWPATTTLYVTLREGTDTGPVIGRGVLRIAAEDFVKQLRTMTVTGPASEWERLELEARFGRSFAGPLYNDYGSVVHRTTRFNRHAPPRPRRPLDLPLPQEFGYRTDDGVALGLSRYRGGRRGPVLLVHGMGANPLTFLLDTVETNLAEYLVQHDFDVWVQEWRASTLLPSANSQFNADTVARQDHPAAQAAIRQHTGRSDLHVVSHCVGSLTWTMATLAGTVDPTSLLCSSVSAHPVGPPITRLKVGLHLGELMRRMGVKTLTTDAFTDESDGARAVDLALRAYPIPKGERCDQAVCRRLAFIYGVAVNHENMNDLTHTTMHELFGLTDTTMMVHLSRMARAERVVSASGVDEYLPHIERLGRPVTLVSGQDNLVWVPESTERTYVAIADALGTEQVRRVVIDGYGHQDVFIGANAARDTFPVVLEHLERSGA
jgi:cholesterol oxidase